MPANFVPLLPGKRVSPVPSGSSPGATATAAAVPAFTPLRATSPSSHTACAATATSPAREPVVTLQKDGDRITSIRIECACGQVIELACSY